MIVHLQLAAEEPLIEILAEPLELAPIFIRIELRQSVAVDDDRVRYAKVSQVAGQDLVEGRCPDECGVIQAEQDDLFDHGGLVPSRDARVDLDPRLAFIERDGPEDPLDASDTVQAVLEHGLDVVDITDRGIHDPEVGARDVGDLAARPEHQTAEDRPLLRDQQCRKSQPQHDPEELGLIADEHLQSNPSHRIPPHRVWSRPRSRSSSPPDSRGVNGPVPPGKTS